MENTCIQRHSPLIPPTFYWYLFNEEADNAWTVCAAFVERISTGECNHLYEDAGRNGTYDTNAPLQKEMN